MSEEPSFARMAELIRSGDDAAAASEFRKLVLFVVERDRQRRPPPSCSSLDRLWRHVQGK